MPESALDSIVVAFPYGKPVSTFPGNALAHVPAKWIHTGPPTERMRHSTTLFDILIYDIEKVAQGFERH
jgi:hypothetical protein